MISLVFFALALALYCGWVCGRSHERDHHRAGSVLGFGGKPGSSEKTT